MYGDCSKNISKSNSCSMNKLKSVDWSMYKTKDSCMSLTLSVKAVENGKWLNPNIIPMDH